MSTPLNFLQASVRADELVANQKMGIGVSGQSSQLHIKASAPEIRLEDKVGAEDSETTTRIYADSGSTYIQSGVNFVDGSSSNIVFGSMGNQTEFVNIGTHGIETTGNLFVNNLQFTQTQGLDQILNVSNTTSNIMTLTNTSDDALNVAGGITLGSNLAVNTDDLFVDTTTGNVGIGTTNPTSKLYIQDDNADTKMTIRGGGNAVNDSNVSIELFETSTNFYGATIQYCGTLATQGLRFGHHVNTATPRFDMAIDRSSGYVGIGTVDPDAFLEVFTNSLGTTTGDSTDIIKFGGDSNGAGALLLTAERLSSGSNWISTGLRLQKIVDNTKMGYIQFGTGSGDLSGEVLFGNGDSTERMRITPNGNVGIGTASPEYPLSFTRAGFAVNVSVVNPMSTAGIGAFNFGDLHVGDNVVTECICIYNPTAENSYGYKCGYVQWIQMKVRGQGIQDTIQIIKSYSADSSTVTVTAGTGSASHNTILTVSNGVADISYTARVFYRALDTP
jgi:hypothetical protein